MVVRQREAAGMKRQNYHPTPRPPPPDMPLGSPGKRTAGGRPESRETAGAKLLHGLRCSVLVDSHLYAAA